MLAAVSTLIASPLSLQFIYLLIYLLYYFLLNKHFYSQPPSLIYFDFLPVFKHLSCTEESRNANCIPDEVTRHTKDINVCKHDTGNILIESAIFNYQY